VDKNESSEPAQPRRGFWHWLWKTPRRWYFLGLPAGAILSFVLGIAATIGVLRPALMHTDTEAFCVSCHEMQTPFAQLKNSYHYSNKFGIRATCSDCHHPYSLSGNLWAHVNAWHDIWGHLTGVIDTPEKFQQHKLAMAQYVWKDLKEDDSAPCRRCHSFAAMNLSEQSHEAAKHHSPEYIAKTGKTCIDCHKGVAHELPVEQ
jgi:nitrate/TMAO reductase-like tetraheme cytochrome c subunit